MFSRSICSLAVSFLILTSVTTRAETTLADQPTTAKKVATKEAATKAAASKKKTPKKEALVKKQLGEMRPVHALGDIYLTGQPSTEDLTLMKQQGIKTVITLRKADEVSWDEATAVEQLGMKFVQVPFRQPEELKANIFDDVLKVLRDKKRGPTVLHCGSANRVGAIWYAHRVLDGKISHEAALKEAKIVGLRTPAYFERAQAYVEKVRKETVRNETKLTERKQLAEKP